MCIHVRIFMAPYFSVRMDLIIIMEMSYEGWDEAHVWRQFSTKPPFHMI